MREERTNFEDDIQLLQEDLNQLAGEKQKVEITYE